MNKHCKTNFEPFLSIYITEECQLKCKHCYMGHRLNLKRKMSIEQITEILRFFRITCNQRRVHLLGGEPSLHPNFNEILYLCKDEGYKIVVPTNGLLSKDIWNNIDLKLIDVLAFSLDGGTKITHEYIRGGNTFDRTLHNINKSVKFGIPTRITSVINRHNINTVGELLRLCELLHINMLSLHYFTSTGNGKKCNKLQLLPLEWIKFCKWLKEQNYMPFEIYYPPAFVVCSDAKMLYQYGYKGCTAKNMERTLIFSDNKVYTCPVFLDREYYYGTFDKNQIITNPCNKEEQSNMEVRLSHNCLDCNNSNICRGCCLGNNIFNMNIAEEEEEKKIVPICPKWIIPLQKRNLEKL